MNYDPSKFKALQSSILQSKTPKNETPEQRHRRINAACKKRRREVLRQWCRDNYGVSDPEAVIVKLMTLDKNQDADL